MAFSVLQYPPPLSSSWGAKQGEEQTGLSCDMRQISWTRTYKFCFIFCIYGHIEIFDFFFFLTHNKIAWTVWKYWWGTWKVEPARLLLLLQSAPWLRINWLRSVNIAFSSILTISFHLLFPALQETVFLTISLGNGFGNWNWKNKRMKDWKAEYFAENWRCWKHNIHILM